MRRKTNQVRVGELWIGSEHPVVVQSMLNTDTMDTEACVEQAIRIYHAGGELVRITAPGVREAENLKAIHGALRARGYTFPLSADIHFNAEAAMVAAKYVEKVRINPGNFVRAVVKKSESGSYTDEEYDAELLLLREKLKQLLDICRRYDTALRIGTNHGSLSARILDRFGNTPAGMAEATLECLRVCREERFDAVVVSLKSSDSRTMIEAVRLLVRRMEAEEMAFPLHLGVTEAGEGEDGRIRSAVGIGTLLNEGIGDTIRVSLTEEPECEIPVARELLRMNTPAYRSERPELPRRQGQPLIVADISACVVVDESVMSALDFYRDTINDPLDSHLLTAGLRAPEVIYTRALDPELTQLPERLRIVVPCDILDVARLYNRRAEALVDAADWLSLPPETGNRYWVKISGIEECSVELLKKMETEPETVLVISPREPAYMAYREIIEYISRHAPSRKQIIHLSLPDEKQQSAGVYAAALVGGFFTERLADGLWITAPADEAPDIGLSFSQNILQSAGVRRYKTEFISCPGCGRTRFNLQESVRRVKEAFAGYAHLKIAVMGCVVNGPGEMGDADYGYVGAGNGKVNLYQAGRLVLAGVDEAEAIDRLRMLIDTA